MFIRLIQPIPRPVLSINTSGASRVNKGGKKAIPSNRTDRQQLNTAMQTIDRIIQLIVSVFLIVGVYQFYFWCQRNPVNRPREFRLPLDDLIPYRPRWVWIYSFLYYPVIVAINWSVSSPRQYLYVAISYLLLLGFQMAFFVLLPVTTPSEWRVCSAGR